MIDDFEDGDTLLPQLDGRSGEWAAKSGDALHPISVVTPGLSQPGYGLKVEWSPTEKATKSIFVYFVEPVASDLCAHDLSAFEGLRMTTRSETWDLSYRVQLIDGTPCADDACGQEFGEKMYSSASAFTHELDFADFWQVEPDGSTLDLSKVVGVRFVLSANLDTLEIDDLELY